MEILVLNASPRRSGIVSQAVGAFVDGVRAADDFVREDVRVDVVDVNDLKFASCRGCMYCREHGNCCLPVDDAHLVAEKIRSCDVLLVAAPVYWGNIPGVLKSLFDRMVYAMMGESALGIPRPMHKGKRAYIITGCTTPFPFNVLCGQTNGVVRALKEILGTAGFKISGKVVVPGTREMTSLPKRVARKAFGMPSTFLNLR